MPDKDLSDYQGPKESNQEFKTNDIHYRRLFETAQDGILVVDADNGNVIDVNPFLTETLGYPRQEIVNKHVWELGFLKKVFSDKNQLVELRQKDFAFNQDLPLKTATGDVLDIELTASPYDIEHQKLIQLNFHILKERKEAEVKLEESEQRLRQLIEEAPIGIALSQQGKTVYANSGYLKMFGFDKQEEIVGTSFLNQIAPESRVQVIERAMQHERGSFVKIDYVIQGLRKDGTQFPFQASINRVDLANGPALIGYFTDITDRQKAEKEIVHLASFPELNPNPVIEISLDGTVKYANPATQKMFPDLVSINTLHPFLAQWQNIVSKFGAGGTDQLQREVDVDGRHYLQTLQYIDSLKTVRIYARDITETKQAQTALTNSEIRYRRLFEAAKDGILILDADTGMVIDVNPFLIQLLGFSAGEFLGKAIWELGFLKDIVYNKGNFLELQNKGYVRYEDLPLETADGRRIEVEFVSNVYEVDHSKVIQCNIRDISERKRTERLAAESELKYRSLFDHMINGFAYCKMHFFKDKPVDFTYLAVNGAFEKQTGLRDVVGKKVSDIIPGILQADPELFERYGRVARGGDPEYFENFVESLKMWFSISVYCPEPGYFVAIFDVITERKKAEADLLRLNRLYDVLSQVNQAVVRANDADSFLENACQVIAERGRFKLAWIGKLESETMAVIPVAAAGLARDYIKHIDITADNQPQGQGPIGRSIQDSKPYIINDFHNDPSTLFWREQAAPYNFGGVVAFPIIANKTTWGALGVYSDEPGYFGDKEVKLLEETAVDIGFALDNIEKESQRKRNEVEQQILRDKAEMSSRLAAVGEMAAGIAHEINNPLTGVIGFSELLLERTGLPDEIREDLKIIHDGSTRVKEIVRRMLTFARQTKPNKSSVNIAELLDNTLELRSYVLKTSNIEVIRDYDPTLPWVTADAGQLQQVFLNIIVNAEYAMKKANGKGTLTIKTEEFAHHVRISISDDGPGMSDQIKAKLFQPFFTTKDPGEGTGLGLSLSYGIIQEHFGTLKAGSAVGKGTTFIIELPINPVEIETVIIPPVVHIIEPVKRARVLVVDDEPSVRSLINTILTQDGHIVEECGNADQAIEKLRGTTFDVLFLDLRMPGMNGMELYGEISTMWPQMARRVIFITGDTSDLNTREYLSTHQIPFISKPFDRKTLESTVNAVLLGN